MSESLVQYKDEVQKRLVETWQRRRPGDPPPRADELLEFMADDLAESQETMITSLNRFLTSTGGAAVPRDERGDCVKLMRQRYVYTRDHIVNVYGESWARSMGFDMATETHPWRLARQVGRALDTFRAYDPEHVFAPEDEWKCQQALRAGYVVSLLSELHERLVEVLTKLVSENKGSEKAFLQKEEAYEDYKSKLGRYAGTGAALFRLVGMDAEAERILPSERRPSRRGEDVPVPESPEVDAAAPSPDADTAPPSVAEPVSDVP